MTHANRARGNEKISWGKRGAERVEGEEYHTNLSVWGNVVKAPQRAKRIWCILMPV